MRKLARCERGQELAETAMVLPILLMIALGIVEFGSAFGSQQSLTSIGREGASIAARGASLDEVNDLMIESGAEIGMDKNGGAITSRVEVENGVPMVREQVASRGYSNQSHLGNEKKPAAGLSQIAKAEGATFYVVELFLVNRDRTPLQKFKGIVVPDTLYSRAVF